MLKKRLSIAAISFIAVVFTSCGEQIVRQDIHPQYVWENNVSQYYLLSGKFDITVDAAVVRYEGKMEVTAEMELRHNPSGDGKYGMALQMLLRNPQIYGGESRVNTALIAYLNKIREWFATIYMTKQGVINVLHMGVPHIVLNTIGQSVFPEFSHMDALWDVYTYKTNYPADVAGNMTLNTYERTSEITGYDDKNMEIKTHISFTTYDQMQYLKSVEPIKMGVATLNFTDIFNYNKGKFIQKAGTVDVRYNMPVSQGIFSVIVSVQVIGEFIIVETNKGGT
jgi:hypothetical protein